MLRPWVAPVVVQAISDSGTPCGSVVAPAVAAVSVPGFGSLGFDAAVAGPNSASAAQAVDSVVTVCGSVVAPSGVAVSISGFGSLGFDPEASDDDSDSDWPMALEFAFEEVVLHPRAPSPCPPGLPPDESFP